jgi:hypothetical protein
MSLLKGCASCSIMSNDDVSIVSNRQQQRSSLDFLSFAPETQHAERFTRDSIARQTGELHSSPVLSRSNLDAILPLEEARD